MLTFEEWLKLSVEEKGERYKDLSDSDKFKVRQGFYFDEDNGKREEEIDIPDFLKEIEDKDDDNTQE